MIVLLSMHLAVYFELSNPKAEMSETKSWLNIEIPTPIYQEASCNLDTVHALKPP